jgi:hypothetical protein
VILFNEYSFFNSINAFSWSYLFLLTTSIIAAPSLFKSYFLLMFFYNTIKCLF